MTELLEAIRQCLRGSDQNEQDSAAPGADGEECQDATAEATVWSWLMQRPDVSLGPDRKYNTLRLQEVVDRAAAARSTGVPCAGRTSNNHENPENPDTTESNPQSLDLYLPADMRARTSEDTMWECIAGHGVDLKRVPRLEWVCLLGIASTKAEGILQGDLGRLVNQDKRSVPKRTDALLKKGHITKRTILVRGTKTSKMWLAKFAPALLVQEPEGSSEPSTAGMDLSHSFLTSDLDPVPWNARWTGESVDYVALATTLMAIVKAWGTIRILDLKAKLGVLGMRWQMKVLSKTCRFLNGRGIIQYVAAMLHEKVFKDCIRYVRDFESKDWTLYLATGKRGGSGRIDDDENAQTLGASRLLLSTHPRWSTDEPIQQYIARTALSVGEVGLTNPDVYSLTLGPSFNRFISTVTSTMATSTVQPAHLKHLQLNSEHVRIGKVASYKYCVPSRSVPRTSSDALACGDDIAVAFGLPPTGAARGIFSGSSILSGFYNGAKKSKSRGRPRSKKLEQCELPLEREADVQQAAPLEERRDGHGRGIQPLPCLVVTLKLSIPRLRDVLGLDTNSLMGRKSPHVADKGKSSISTRMLDSEPLLSGGDEPVSGQSPAALEITDRGEATALKDRVSNPEEPVVVIESVPSEGNDIGHKPKDDSELKDIEQPARDSGGRGRGSGRGRGRGRGGSSASANKPYTCENCGGSWKNDLGLKYHLEKSKTSCNPNYVPKPPRKMKLQEAMDAAGGSKRRGRISAEREDDANLASHGNDTATRAAASDNGTFLSARTSRLRSHEKPELSDGPAAKEEVGGIYSIRVSRPRRSITGIPRSSVAHTDPRIGQGKLLSTEGLPTLTVTELRRSTHDTLQESLGARSGVALVPDEEKENIGKSLRGTGAENATIGDWTAKQTTAIIKEPQVVGREPLEDIEQETAPPIRTLSRAERFRRVEHLTESILSEHDGVFPGSTALWRTLRIAWIREYPSEASPTNKEFQASLRWLTGRKIVSEHWHAFRNPNGSFAKCQVITWPDVDAFSPQSLELLEQMKTEYPKPFIPGRGRSSDDWDLQVDEDLSHGRRPLPSQVSQLSAPVYAAQIAAKREVEENENEERERKRQRKAAQATPRRERFRLAREIDHPGLHESVRSLASEVPSEGPPLIQFLDPNTYMEDEPPGYTAEELDGFEPPPFSEYGEFVHSSEETLMQDSAQATMFVASRPIIQSDTGLWPSLDQRFFEECPSSLTLDGWVPSAQWFSWETMRQSIDTRAKLRASSGRKATVNQASSLHRRFMRSLLACVEVEMQWSDNFVLASHGAAGPHNIFIPFLGSQIVDLREDAELRWSEGNQFTVDSMPSDEIEIAPSESSSADELESFRKRRTARPSQVRIPQKPRKIARKPKNVAATPSKRVQLARRRLTTIPEHLRTNVLDPTEAPDLESRVGDTDEVLAAIVAIRALLGGVERSIDWGLLVRLFPNIGLSSLRKYWSSVCASESARITRYTQAFYDKFLAACENDQISVPNYEDPLDYDWDALIRWTMEIPGQEGIQIPATREAVDNLFDLDDGDQVEEDWTEKFFHPMASTYARLEVASAQPAALVVDVQPRPDPPSKMEVARSWVRSVCCTSETSYTPEAIRAELQRLASLNPSQAASLQTAIDQLTHEKIIHKSKRPALGGRSYRLTEAYLAQLNKSASWSKYEEAADLKMQLDKAFRQGKSFEISYTVTDGAMMALLNMYSHGRIDIVAVDIPHIPLGFEPGNYESRKFPKSYYHFGVEATPTATYEYSDDIETLRAVVGENIPSQGPDAAKPQWVDLFGHKKVVRWYEILGAVCLVLSIRGQMAVDGICAALQPLLEQFEAQLIIIWGKKTGVLKETSPDGDDVTVGEWWWLAIPWSRRLG